MSSTASSRLAASMIHVPSGLNGAESGDFAQIVYHMPWRPCRGIATINRSTGVDTELDEDLDAQVENGRVSSGSACRRAADALVCRDVSMCEAVLYRYPRSQSSKDN